MRWGCGFGGGAAAAARSGSGARRRTARPSFAPRSSLAFLMPPRAAGPSPGRPSRPRPRRCPGPGAPLRTPACAGP
ncbi:hypothetical protein TU94_14025 [Streptomyces cyaneogriseus subsp. noncyanogenus]|uniref:Uncharacterized protein n=1 Tax=Streptomyces cyaneogriseus subsp. noncyanogenus TaxID=477245 RepID=A0A0C5FR01_9ACTN|nr:hypothetical protein TU94_14025 [Streptomyces cyaneogriseus subsp. noncyanogenus]